MAHLDDLVERGVKMIVIACNTASAPAGTGASPPPGRGTRAMSGGPPGLATVPADGSVATTLLPDAAGREAHVASLKSDPGVA